MATELSLLKSGHASNSTAATEGRRDAAKIQTRTSNKAERAGPFALSKPCSLLPDTYQQSLTWSQVAKEECPWFEEPQPQEAEICGCTISTVQAFLRISPL